MSVTYIRNHFKYYSMHRLADELSQIKELLRTHPQGMTVTEIASALGRNKHSTGRYLDILHAAGHVDLRTFGMAKVFKLSSRIPLSALLSYTTDLVLVLDRNMRVVQGNDPFYTLLGLPGEEIIQQELAKIPSQDEGVVSFLSRLSEGLEKGDETLDLSIQGENSRSFRCKIIPTVFDDGAEGTTIIMEDVTAIREAVHNMQESEAFFRSISEHLSDGLIVSEDENLIFHNQRLCEITGYGKDEISKMLPEDLALPEEKMRFLKTIGEAAMDQGEVKEIRFWAQKKDQSPIYLSVRVSTVPFGDRVRRYILITDMTRWKEQEEAKTLQATLISRLMENFPHPIFIIGEEGVFFMANRAFCDLIQYDDKKVSGKHATDVMPAEIAEGFLKGNNELARQDLSTHVHSIIPFFKQDGTIGEVLIEKSPVSAGENAPTYIFGVVLFESDCKSIRF